MKSVLREDLCRVINTTASSKPKKDLLISLTCMTDKTSRIVASVGLALGGIFGMAGTFAPDPHLRATLWAIDGLGLVMATALLTIMFYRLGHDVVASGFLIFAIGEGIILTGAPMEINASVPAFGTGTGLWALSLCVTSLPAVFPLPVRIIGIIGALLFFVTSFQIFAGATITPLSSPLPSLAYPLLVATLFGWIWSLLADKIENLNNK